MILSLSQGVTAKERKRERAMFLEEGVTHVENLVSELWYTKEQKFSVQLRCLELEREGIGHGAGGQLESGVGGMVSCAGDSELDSVSGDLLYGNCLYHERELKASRTGVMKADLSSSPFYSVTCCIFLICTYVVQRY